MSTTEFDQYADQYEQLVHDPIRNRFARGSEFFALRKWHLLRDYLRRRKRDAAQMAWLDVGCGTGTLLKLAGSAFASARGCDPSEKMLEACQGLDVRVQTENRLPYEDRQFDLITLVCVLHHVPPAERAQLLAEVARVARPGGVVCIFEHNPWNPVTQLIVSRTPVDRDAQLLTSGTARRLLRQAGLRDQGCTYFLYLPEVLYRSLGFLEQLGTKVPLGGQYAAFGLHHEPAGANARRGTA
ncbi:MAG: class I SAM-dependent methyltransferase [Pirellulaceae bacterium]|nr:class I SAM-dependent methyltransferase [Pirellulaceae bacterium]